MNDKNIKFPPVCFVTGIGTDVGKSYATAWLALEIMKSGESVITQKFIQTGCHEWSEDIQTHRRLMGIEPTPDDLLHITAPIIFSYPASPHLAAKLDNRELDLNLATESTRILKGSHDHVLIEGAGGIMVALHGNFLTIDYIRQQQLPVIVVTTGQLGSINTTLLTLRAIDDWGLSLFALVYNPHFDKDEIICSDTRNYLKGWMEEHYPDSFYLEMPEKF